MNIEQRKLALQAVDQLVHYSAYKKEEISRDLESHFKAIESGVKRNGVEVTAAGLKEAAGEEIWNDILAQKEALEAFVNG